MTNIVGIINTDGFHVHGNRKELGMISMKNKEPTSYFFQDSIHFEELDNIVLKFYEENRINKNSAIVYKGGDFEKDMLERLKLGP